MHICCQPWLQYIIIIITITIIITGPLTQTQQSKGFLGTPPTMGPPYGKLDPYHSHIFRDSYGSDMGII